jgi:hypothetical protein
MDSRLSTVIRRLIQAERDRSAREVAVAIAEAIHEIPAGHSARVTAADREAARDYESRGRKWLALVKRAFAETNLTWTEVRAAEVVALLTMEMATDWDQLTNLVRTRIGPRLTARYTNLDAAQERTSVEIASEVELLVLARDRNAIPIDEQLRAPRYAAVETAWIKSKTLLGTTPPDLSNAVKEAIGAVEQLARIVADAPKATLGDSIKEFKRAGLIQTPLLKGIDEIWGWASETPGVRHGSTGAPKLDSAVATYVTSIAAAAIRLLLAADTPKSTRARGAVRATRE